MWHQRKMIGGFTAVMLLLGTVSALKAAAMPSHSTANGGFERIEQPLGITLGVAAGGLFLIGLELWWFLWSKLRAKQPTVDQGIQPVNHSQKRTRSPQ